MDERIIYADRCTTGMTECMLVLCAVQASCVHCASISTREQEIT